VQAGGHALPLDVTDESSMAAAVERIIADQGRIDVLVNNAGYGSYGAVEEIPMAEARHQMEVNVFGLARMTQLVLPHMRARKSGRIINVGSVGGTIWSPLGAWYHGTKWFVEGFSNSLRAEVAGFGIDVVVVAPGAIDTGFTGVLMEKIEKASGNGPYKSIVQAYKNSSVAHHGSPPTVVAASMRRAVEDARPATIYRMGRFGRLMVVMARLMPRRVFDRMLMAALA